MKPHVVATVLGCLQLVGCALFAAEPAAGTRDSAAQFRALIDRPRVPLAPEVTERPESTQFSEFHFTYASDAKDRVPGILIKPKSAAGRLPVVIALHGTGGGKESQLVFLKNMASRGFIGVAIDGRYHGERTKEGKGSTEYQEAILAAWHGSGEHPFFYDSVWDVMRLIDYLETRSDVDPMRIGLIGISKGGIETYLTAAVDPRIAVAVPCIAVESFRWAVDNDSWRSRIGTVQIAFDAAAKDAKSDKDAAMVQKFYDRVAPGIDGAFDGPAMVPLIAPRPLLTINGAIDPRTPAEGLKICLDAIQQAYRRAGAEDRYKSIVEDKTGHRVNPDSLVAAEEWFERWLGQK